MIEILAGIAILVGILWPAVSNYIEGGRASAKVHAEHVLLSTTVDCIRGARGFAATDMVPFPGFMNVNTAVIAYSACLDKFDVVNSATSISNTYAGTLSIDPVGSLSRITVTGYDQDACTGIPIKFGQNYQQIRINNTPVKSVRPDIALTASAVVSACVDGRNNTLSFDIDSAY